MFLPRRKKRPLRRFRTAKDALPRPPALVTLLEILPRGSVQHFPLASEDGPVAGAIPRLGGVVPANNAPLMRAFGGQLMGCSRMVSPDGDLLARAVEDR